MPIGKNKTQLNFAIDKELKKLLEEQAKKESRTTSNLLNKIIEDYLNTKKD